MSKREDIERKKQILKELESKVKTEEKKEDSSDDKSKKKKKKEE